MSTKLAVLPCLRSWPRKSARSLQELFHETAGIEDAGAAVLLQHEEVTIAGDEQISLGGLAKCKEVVVIRIAADLLDSKGLFEVVG